MVEKGNTSVSSVWQESWTATKAVIRVPTFQIIVLQGIVGSLPWTAMVFFTMWFELIGKHLCEFYKHTLMKIYHIIASLAATGMEYLKSHSSYAKQHYFIGYHLLVHLSSFLFMMCDVFVYFCRF